SIKTAAESIVDLDLGVNGPVVRVTPDTTVGLDKLTRTGTGADSVIETRLNVENGSIIGSVNKLAKASKYEIKTPNGVAGIRGTDYVIKVKKLSDGSYEVTFTDVTGTLVVVARVNGNPETVVLNAGESWTPGSSVIPTPQQLLEFYREQVRAAIAAIGGGGGGNQPAVVTSPVPVIEPYVSPVIGAKGGATAPDEFPFPDEELRN
ncbi:MAG: FecR domain-containing protein, partial [Verrucomicrobiota bacterium]